MPFFDQRFPEHISRDAKGGPVWSTTVVKTGSGKRATNRNWAAPLHRYEVGHAVRTGANFEILRAFFYCVAGQADGFRFKDWADFTATAGATGNSRCLLLAGNTTLQLQRVYAAFGREYVRKITRPVSGTVSVTRTRGGSPSVIGATVDHATGIATISGHVGGDTYTWAGQFDVPVAFADDEALFTVFGGPQMQTAWPDIRIEEVRE